MLVILNAHTFVNFPRRLAFHKTLSTGSHHWRTTLSYSAIF